MQSTDEILARRDLTATAKVVYVWMATGGSQHPYSLREISNQTGTAARTVSTAIRQLRESGLVQVERGMPNQYLLTCRTGYVESAT